MSNKINFVSFWQLVKMYPQYHVYNNLLNQHGMQASLCNDNDGNDDDDSTDDADGCHDGCDDDEGCDDDDGCGDDKNSNS